MATQQLVLNVNDQFENRGPHIDTQPALFAYVDKRYVYDPHATDADGDLLIWSLEEAPNGMLINEGTGRIVWRPTHDYVGSWNVTVIAQDGLGGKHQQSFVVKVLGNNLPPLIQSTAISQAIVDEEYFYAVQARDPEGGSVAFSLITPPPFMAIDGDGVIHWIPRSNQVGSNRVTVRAVDAEGNASFQVFDVAVLLTHPNQPPVLQSQPVRFATDDSLYQYQVEAFDPELQPIAYALRSSPAGMEIDPKTGMIAWNTPILETAQSYGVVRWIGKRWQSRRDVVEKIGVESNFLAKLVEVPKFTVFVGVD